MIGESDLPEIARRYAAGQLAWRDIAAQHDIAFDYLLVDLGRQGLKLPLSGPLPSSSA